MPGVGGPSPLPMPLHHPHLERYSYVAWNASHFYGDMADEDFGERLVERQPSDSGFPKALASLMMLISWEIQTERNARVFRNTAIPSMVLMCKIKEEVSLWTVAGAKHMSVVMPRE